MDKGIRPYCNNKFVELNEQRRRGLMNNTAFRKSVIADLMEQFDCTLASAATHYNQALHTVRELNAELVSGLGRPAEKNNGGRKKKAVVATAPNAILANMLAATQGNKARPTEATAKTTEEPEEAAVNSTPEVLYNVRKVSDGTLVAEGLTLELGNELVQKAAKAKKAKLETVPA